jgi:hypothetical protein
VSPDPVEIPPVNRLHKFKFTVTDEEYALFTNIMTSSVGRAGGLPLPVVEHFDGSLSWRLRACKLMPDTNPAPAEHEWAIKETSWPPQILVTLNGQPVEMQWRTHNGEGLPAELTTLIRCGQNLLEIGVVDLEKDADRSAVHAAAVELVETRSH